MKRKMLITLIFIALILVSFLFKSYIMPDTKTEEQKYTVLKTYPEFEIRFYPSATIAIINSNAHTYKELSRPGFQKLAGYIFGGNETNKKISMTSPVQMDINDSVSKMSFVMPAEYKKEELPKPNDPGISIQNTADEYVAAIRFSGYAADSDIKLFSEKLQHLLNENGIKPLGNYRLLGYNPPYQVIDRRNEIIVAIEWKK